MTVRVDAQAARLAAELREALDDPKRYEWGDGPWEHLGDAERDVRVLLDGITALAARLEAAETALRRIEAGETVPGGAGVIRSSSAKIAREYLLAAGRGTHGCSESTR